MVLVRVLYSVLSASSASVAGQKANPGGGKSHDHGGSLSHRQNGII